MPGRFQRACWGRAGGRIEGMYAACGERASPVVATDLTEGVSGLRDQSVESRCPQASYTTVCNREPVSHGQTWVG